VQDATFDAVLRTTVLHCSPEDARRQSIGEMSRVLKPEGRLLIVDFGGPAEGRHSLIAHQRGLIFLLSGSYLHSAKIFFQIAYSLE
jgi:ubiquinone/menaquinone biosynthesis C-methylase UbiE